MNRWWIQENCHWCCSHVTPKKLYQIAVHHWPLLHTSQKGALPGHQRHNPNYEWQNFYVFLDFYILLIHYHRKKRKKSSLKWKLNADSNLKIISLVSEFHWNPIQSEDIRRVLILIVSGSSTSKLTLPKVSPT